ncbi:MAG: RNA polymerase-binding protein DksA [Gammaproteobacteria bacterium]|nr:RNA polymerase-binding protein DksA [Gammaproteobacteria bacterium]
MAVKKVKKIAKKINKKKHQPKRNVVRKNKIVKVKQKVKAKTKPQIKSKAKKLTKIKPKIKTKAKVMTKKQAPKKIKAKPAKGKKIVAKKIVAAKHAPVLGPSGVKPYQMKEKEEYMNHKQLEHLRRILLNWKNDLMREVDRTMHHMQDESANYPDPIDRASQEEEFNLELRTRDRERKLLKKIEETLGRIEEDDYGYCDVCGAEIGIRRLEARPTATMCIECKTIAEIREKQTGEPS